MSFNKTIKTLVQNNLNIHSAHTLRFCLIHSFLLSFYIPTGLKGRIQGGAMGAKPPLDQWNLLISGGFQAPTGADPPRLLER